MLLRHRHFLHSPNVVSFNRIASLANSFTLLSGTPKRRAKSVNFAMYQFSLSTAFKLSVMRALARSGIISHPVKQTTHAIPVIHSGRATLRGDSSVIKNDAPKARPLNTPDQDIPAGKTLA